MSRRFDAWEWFLVLVVYWPRIMMVAVAAMFLTAVVAAVIFMSSCAPVPQPPPVTTTTTTTTTLPPEPVGCYAPIPGSDGDYEAVPGTFTPVHKYDVLAARNALNLGDCVIGPQLVRLMLLAAELRERGMCASQNEDRVLVCIEKITEKSGDVHCGNRVEEYHAQNYKTGCWAADGGFRGVLEWRAK